MSGKLYKYFSPKELQCRCGKCDSTGDEMKLELMEPLIVLRETLGFPFPVNSAYRCPFHNNGVSHTGFNGPHTTGLAIDIGVYTEKAVQLVAEAYRMRVFRGFGINQKGLWRRRFIHLDVVDRDALWSY